MTTRTQEKTLIHSQHRRSLASHASSPFVAAGAGISSGLAAMAAVIVTPIAAFSHHWLFLDLVLGAIGMPQYEVGTVRFDLADIIYLMIAIHLFLAWPRLRRRSHFVRPILSLWILACCLQTAAYLWTHPYYWSNLHQVVYQAYRYCVRPSIYFFFASILIASRRELLRPTLLTIVGLGVALSLWASIQGYTGQAARASFNTGNMLGAVLIAPSILTLHFLLVARSRAQRVGFTIALLVIVRGLLFSLCRGALLAVSVGGSLVFLASYLRDDTRRSTRRLAATVMLSLLVMGPALPWIMTRPTVAPMLAAYEPTADSNFEWRITQRWPHFTRQLLEHPWAGTGTDTDLTLGPAANTPHNGYLSLALRYGIPATIALLLVPIAAIVRAARIGLLNPLSSDFLLSMSTIASIIGICVHNLADGILVQPYVLRYFWLLVALLASPGLLQGRPAARPPSG